MAELVFFSGTMDCGKSTLALQLDHNHAARGRGGVVYTRDDRAGHDVLSSRLGLRHAAVEVRDDTDFWDDVVQRRSHGARVDYVVCDEAQFYSPRQVEQLAQLVDELGVDVFAFGITADFRTRLFPGSARLIELADRVEVLQVQSLCWCGARATHNARTVDGVMVVEGEQVVVGDTRALDATGAPDASAGRVRSSAGQGPQEARPAPVVAYEVLCRRHHLRRMTSAAARATAGSPETLPLEALGTSSD